MVNFKRILLSVLTFWLVSAPAFAQNWDYVLNNYQDTNDRQEVKKYLNAFNKDLKRTWESPTYKTINSRSVVFYLNKDGSVSDIKILESKQTAASRFDKYLHDFLTEVKFKSFPKEIKEDKIKMGYVFVGNCQKTFGSASPTVYDWSKAVFKEEAKYDSK